MTRPTAALLLLGGNVGDRGRRLRDGLSGLSRLQGTRLLGVSRVWETAPVGPSRRPFWNVAARVRTRLSPMGLLIECKRLEAAAGRRPGRRWGPRPLDIDVIAYDRRRVATRWLRVPHPRVAARAFALGPLSELAPDWKPDGRRTVFRLLARLSPAPREARPLP